MEIKVVILVFLSIPRGNFQYFTVKYSVSCRFCFGFLFVFFKILFNRWGKFPFISSLLSVLIMNEILSIISAWVNFLIISMIYYSNMYIFRFYSCFLLKSLPTNHLTARLSSPETLASTILLSSFMKLTALCIFFCF